MPDPARVLELASSIEAEMRRIGSWQEKPLRREQRNFRKAFAMDTMEFAEWLQFVFLPRARQAAASRTFPRSSSVGAQAMREFDGHDEAARLVSLLSELDSLFD